MKTEEIVKSRSLLSTAILAMALCGSTALLDGRAARAADEPTSGSDQPATDSWITTKVKAELATTDEVKSFDISVKTIDGVVYLTGALATKAAVDNAVAAAKTVKGVKKVDASNLKVKD